MRKRTAGLQAAPAIERIIINSHANVPLGRAVLQSVSAALNHGALRNLDGFELYGCTVEEEDVKDFMDVLEKSGCGAASAFEI